jgi:putative selenium metabolism hydrolase
VKEMSNIKDQVLKTLNDRKDETVELLRELIRTQSITGEEREIADLIARKLKIFGFEDVRIDGVGNVICKLAGSGEGPTLLYNGHMDTVPAGERSLWKFDPFGAEIVNNTIVGRGACDMKGSIVAMMMAADAIRRADVKLKGILILTMVVKEENAMEEGTKYTIEEDGLKPDIALVGEATNLNISLGARGRIEVDILVRGRSAHASDPSRGINAISKMTKMIAAIPKMKLPRHGFLGFATQAVTNISCQPGRSNVIPNLCTISVDRRVIPGETPEKIKADFLNVIKRIKLRDPEFDADVKTGKSTLPGYISPSDPAVKILQSSSMYVLSKKPKLSKYTFGTDASYLSTIAKIPTVGFGPGDEVNAHSVNDHVRIDDLVAASKVYASFIIDLLS